MLAPSAKLICVDPIHVNAMWPIVAPMIDRAFAEVDAHVPVDLFTNLSSGKQLLWVVSDADHEVIYAFITELYVRRSGAKVCRLVAGAGERMDEWLNLQVHLEDYARAEGCAKIVAEGRPGWHRALDGYREIRRVIEKDL